MNHVECSFVTHWLCKSARANFTTSSQSEREKETHVLSFELERRKFRVETIPIFTFERSRVIWIRKKRGIIISFFLDILVTFGYYRTTPSTIVLREEEERAFVRGRVCTYFLFLYFIYFFFYFIYKYIFFLDRVSFSLIFF